MTSERIRRAVAAVEGAVVTLDRVLAEMDRQLLDLDGATAALDQLAEVVRTLSCCRDDLADRIARLMPERSMVLAGKMRVRHQRVARRNWKHDDLLRVVIDSRTVDLTTGEVESPVSVLRRVYGLFGYQARVKALRDLDIDVDDFCETESRGFTLVTK
jgi:hypothetical protein